MRRRSGPATPALWAAFLLLASGCQRQVPALRSAPTEPNKALVRRWIDEGFNRQNLAVVDTLFSERFAVNGQIVGRAGLKLSMRRFLGGFPDLHVTVDHILAEADQVTIWYTVEATHQGEFAAMPATGKHVRWVGADLFRIENGQVAEARFLSDDLGLLTQLGATVIPRPQQGARP